MARSLVLSLVLAACSGGSRSAVDAGFERDAASMDDASSPVDAATATDAVGSVDAALAPDAPLASDAGGWTTCDVGAGHTCTRWARTDPAGDDACLGYDGLGVVCTNDPTSGSCDVGSGHTCTRWVRTEPDGAFACLGYDGLGAICG